MLTIVKTILVPWSHPVPVNRGVEYPSRPFLGSLRQPRFLVDPILVASAVKRPIHFMAKKELFRYPLLAYLFRKIHAFPVNRGKPDLGAIKTGLSILKNGEVLGIFPEGTRQKNTDRLGEMHAGAALFALRTGAPVVPAAIRGSYKIGAPVVIVFGDSMKIEPKTGQNAVDMEEGAHAVERAISQQWDSIRAESRVEREVRHAEDKGHEG